MTEAYPIFFNSATDDAFVAPAHAMVVSTRAKLVTPGTDSFVTPCASKVTAEMPRAQLMRRAHRCCMAELSKMKPGWFAYPRYAA